VGLLLDGSEFGWDKLETRMIFGRAGAVRAVVEVLKKIEIAR
jgi:hypothetical protein